MTGVSAADPYDARRARGADGLLRAFNEAGVLTAADVHVARRLGALGGEADEAVLLAAALAVRAPRLGHVLVDLATIRETAAVDAEEPVDLGALPWPAPEGWVDAVAGSALVAVGEDGPHDRPLRLLGTRLHLDRYWREERQVAADLLALAGAPPAGIDLALLADGLDRTAPPVAEGAAAPPAADQLDLFAPPPAAASPPGDDPRQRLAAAAAVLSRLAVVAGGPGTGKTTTVARIVALLAEQAAAAGEPPPLVALAAPTGRAAARLEEAVHEAAAALDVGPPVRALLQDLRATTLHRLLGRRPGSASRFRHHRLDRLPHDVVVVDETSMVSLTLMARLVEAVRPDARLVLVGDPGQLTSIEAGAVLGDVVGPAAERLRIRPAARALLAEATGAPVDAADGPPIGDGIVVLDRVHRFGGGIARLADAVRRGDADEALAVLAEAPDGVRRLGEDDLPALEEAATAAARAVLAAARDGDAAGAVEALGAFRLLCAHRRGPSGVATWVERLEGRLGADGRWYVGRPLLVTQNDPELRLHNGDVGVIVQTPAGRRAAFERGGEVVAVAPERLGAVETAFAMTVHKAQGSQVATAAVVLPEPGSRLLTRELLYTAITRARHELLLAGSEEAVRAAVARPAARASGLHDRLWA